MLSGKRLFLLGVVLILLAAIPLTTYLVSKQSETRSRATQSTKLSFTPASSQAAPITKAVGDTFTIGIMIDPGTNAVIHTTLSINFDPTKLAIADATTSKDFNSSTDITNKNFSFPKGTDGFPPLPSVLDGPNSTNGNTTIAISTGTDITRAIKTPLKIAAVTFKALAPTTPGTPVQLTFGTQTTITATVSDPETNVLSSTLPAFIAITGSAAATPTPTVAAATPTIAQAGLACTALNVDRVTNGIAPFSIIFTANGSDQNNNITKASFNFGEGAVQDITDAGGLGTKSVSVQISHIYHNPGTFKATSVLTNSAGATSNPSTCAQTITVSDATPSATIAPTETPIVASPTPTMKPSGPGDKILGVGTIGAVISIIGAIMFFAL